MIYDQKSENPVKLQNSYSLEGITMLQTQSCHPEGQNLIGLFLEPIYDQKTNSFTVFPQKQLNFKLGYLQSQNEIEQMNQFQVIQNQQHGSDVYYKSFMVPKGNNLKLLLAGPARDSYLPQIYIFKKCALYLAHNTSKLYQLDKMCKKAQPLSQKPSHLQLGSFKLITPFHSHRYLKKVVQDIRLTLEELDLPQENDIEFQTLEKISGQSPSQVEEESKQE